MTFSGNGPTYSPFVLLRSVNIKCFTHSGSLSLQCRCFCGFRCGWGCEGTVRFTCLTLVRRNRNTNSDQLSISLVTESPRCNSLTNRY